MYGIAVSQVDYGLACPSRAQRTLSMQDLLNLKPALLSCCLVIATASLSGCGKENGSYSDHVSQQIQERVPGSTDVVVELPAGSMRQADGITINGSLLSAEEVRGITNTYGIEPRPGNYWYDPVSGLYGVVGYQAYGFMLTGHDFGPLSRTCSNGFSGVLVNGRELQAAEVQLLNRILGAPVQRGSYWLDSFGNAGIEGSPVPLGNLFVAAAQNGYSGSSSGSAGGGDNFWSTAFSAGNSDRGGTRGYVSVPGYGPVGYGF